MTENEPVYASDSMDEKLRKMAPFHIEIMEREKKAIVAALYRAKRGIDNMHPKEREVHDIDRAEIREIERDIRKRLNQLDFEGDTWQPITLSDTEVKAILEGLTNMVFEDGEMTDRCKRLYNLISHETNPYNNC